MGKQVNKLWKKSVINSRVVRIDADVFRVLQKIAIEERLETSTPGQILRKVFEEKGLFEKGVDELDVRVEAPG